MTGDPRAKMRQAADQFEARIGGAKGSGRFAGSHLFTPSQVIAAFNLYEADLAAKDAEIARLREALAALRAYGCPVCSGDCGSANPPVLNCPMRDPVGCPDADWCRNNGVCYWRCGDDAAAIRSRKATP